MAKRTNQWILRFLLVLFSGIFLLSMYQIISIWSEYRKGEITYEEMTAYVKFPQTTEEGTDEPSDTPSQSEKTQNESNYIIVDFETLTQRYKDVVAWIYLPDSTLNYPVVQGSDNEYYLTHMIDGTENSAGAIFMDYRCDRGFGDKNTVLYGHHMHNDSMFRSVARYQKQSYYDTHPIIHFVTIDKQYELVIFSAYVTGIDQNSWQLYFPDEEQYAVWLQDITARSEIDTGIIPQKTERVVTLSTCTSISEEDERIVVHGILREVS